MEKSPTLKVLFADSDGVTDCGPDDPIMAPTNRGNKMHANAKFVSEGALGYINGEEFYKQVRWKWFRVLPW